MQNKYSFLKLNNLENVDNMYLTGNQQVILSNKLYTTVALLVFLEWFKFSITITYRLDLLLFCQKSVFLNTCRLKRPKQLKI